MLSLCVTAGSCLSGGSIRRRVQLLGSVIYERNFKDLFFAAKLEHLSATTVIMSAH